MASALSLVLTGCRPPPPPRVATTRPTSHPAAPPASQPALQAIEVHNSLYLARIAIRTTITPAGLLRSVRTDNSDGVRTTDLPTWSVSKYVRGN